jgi:trehalose synthase
MGMAIFIKEKMVVRFIWRCHIGLDKHSSQTDAVWQFLKPYADVFSLSIFSAPEYIPAYLTGKSAVMYPSIDPLDHKNRDLPIHKVVGILCNSNLITEYHPVLTPPFVHSVKRLQPDGNFQTLLNPPDMGLLFKPVILQISRWDKLKGFLSLMKGFSELKENMSAYANSTDRDLRKLQLAQLVLAGPDPDFVDDDPEGQDVLRELTHHYLSLHHSIQSHIAILKLPMYFRKDNEVIVNALQRIATIVVQNSLKEGFGLTVTEALWKIKPVIGTYAYGIKQQIQHNLNGILIQDPFNKEEIASKLNYALAKPKEREVWGYRGQKKVIENFLIFTQIRKWLRIFASV